MNILITGATGLLGINLVQTLVKQHNLYAVVRNHGKSTMDLPGVKVINTDLTVLDVKQLPKEIDAIYYLAQSDRFREFPDGAEDMRKINVSAPLKIIEWAIKNNVKKFFYVSTGGIYSYNELPVTQLSTIYINEKRGFYFETKIAAEILLRSYSNYFETFAILRPFFMYGPGQNATMLIPRLINNIISGNEIFLQGEEGIKINPIYIQDAASAFENLLNLKGEFLINIAGCEIVSIKILSELIGSIINKKPRFKLLNAPQLNLIGDTTLMETLLYKPKISIKEGVKLMLTKN